MMGVFAAGTIRRIIHGKALALAAAIALGLAAGAPRADSGVVTVVVSIPPQAGIVERVGGDHVVVRVLVQSGQDPHTYEATPRQIMEIGGAQAFLTIGLPFEERLVEKLRGSGVRLQFIDMAADIPRRALVEGDGHGHAGGQPDPHVWLAPASVERLAANCARALQALDPGHTEAYQCNLEAFTAEVRLADARIRELLAPVRGERFYVFHPAFGYFADAFGLEQVAVEIEGKEPTSRHLEQVIAAARADGVRIMFVQPQFSARSASTVADAIGGVVVPMDPLARDVLSNLESMARQVRDALAR